MYYNDPMILKLLAAVCLAAAAQSPEEGADVRLLSLSGRAYAFERIGSLTSFRCADREDADDCALLDTLDLQPQVDWDRLSVSARKQSSKSKAPVEHAVDRFGGPWKVSLSRSSSYVVAPDFPGYKVSFEGGKVSVVEVLRDRDQWAAACRELGLGEDGKRKKKKGFGVLFE